MDREQYYISPGKNKEIDLSIYPAPGYKNRSCRPPDCCIERTAADRHLNGESKPGRHREHAGCRHAIGSKSSGL